MQKPAEVHVFMWLADLFKERGWANPHLVHLETGISAAELLQLLEINRDLVEVVFVNHRAGPVEGTRIRPGDRVALVPPGVPGPHRALLGFKNT
ncbi:MoaD/ThiS family protein [Holophaga foetida]|uniref:MoaD/ThiS family protein n=1 Tax=Holophaga foetida TaxID=35839 RepID=UPI0002474D79|nr:MoaD/ThiS family protein [Holophaga foetida]